MGGARQDAGPPLMEGWMDKRGPTIDYKWMRRWCVLTPTALNYFVDESLKVQKGTVPVRRGTKVDTFLGDSGCNPSAPGEAVKHHREKPHGFVLDVDPSGGRARRLFYFDAGDQAALKAWVGHISRGVAGQRASLLQQALPASPGKGAPDSSSPSSPAGALFGRDGVEVSNAAASPKRTHRASSRGSIVDAGLVSPRGSPSAALKLKAPAVKDTPDLEQLRDRLRDALEDSAVSDELMRNLAEVTQQAVLVKTEGRFPEHVEELRDRLCKVLEDAAASGELATSLAGVQQKATAALSPNASSLAGALFGRDQVDGSADSPIRRSRASTRGSIVDAGLVSPRGLPRGSSLDLSPLPKKAPDPPGVDLDQLRGRLRNVLEEGMADGSLDTVLEQVSPCNKGTFPDQEAPEGALSPAGALFGCDRPSLIGAAAGSPGKRMSRAHSRGSMLESGLVSPPPSPRSGARTMFPSQEEAEKAISEARTSRQRMQEKSPVPLDEGCDEKATAAQEPPSPDDRRAARGSLLRIFEGAAQRGERLSEKHRNSSKLCSPSDTSAGGAPESIEKRQRLLCQEIARQAVAEMVAQCLDMQFPRQQEEIKATSMSGGNTGTPAEEEEERGKQACVGDIAKQEVSNILDEAVQNSETGIVHDSDDFGEEADAPPARSKLHSASSESKRCSLSMSQTRQDEEVKVEVHTSPERLNLSREAADAGSNGDPAAIPAGRHSLLKDQQAAEGLATLLHQQAQGALAAPQTTSPEDAVRRRASLEAVKMDPSLLAGAPSALLQDKSFVKEAVESNPEALAHALAEHKADRDIVLAAVSKDGRALRYSNEILRGDKEVVLAAVMQESGSLEYASEELKRDETLIIF